MHLVNYNCTNKELDYPFLINYIINIENYLFLFMTKLGSSKEMLFGMIKQFLGTLFCLTSPHTNVNNHPVCFEKDLDIRRLAALYPRPPYENVPYRAFPLLVVTGAVCS